LTETHSPETARAYLQSADEAVVGAAELVRRLLTFSRKLEPDPRPLDLNQQVIRSIRLIERTIPRMIGIETYLAPDLWSIHGDPQQAEQVLINLCTNARDAMPEGGRLTVETANVLLDEEYARNFLDVTPGRYVRVRVTDTGVGMDENTRRQMFEPFFTTKPVGEGTGLGLFTVYGIVKGHGGHIAVQSEPGRGASFLIHFPACAEANADTQYPRKHLEAAPGGHETILVVDDEKAILDVVENVLARHGYQVLTAEGGEKALDLYRGLGYRVDLVILDLGMPGMGGYGCLKKLLGMAPQAKVLIASGYATDEHRRQSLAYGAKGFIGKPYRITELLKRIRVVLDA
jgi:CheY-like chemotaxis protein